ncbi:MAG: biotin--[acetyl-CoA-carboxylase] ligase [Ferruginibacter sp.]
MQQFELFSILDSVDSTNNYAMARVHEGMAKHGMAWYAREQTSGRGQRGKHWVTGKDKNIALSIVLEPAGIHVGQQFQLSAAVALACSDFLKFLSLNTIFIKWPNDLYLGDRKAGGILIENIIQGTKWKFAVAGIGININEHSFDPGLPNAVSLLQITRHTYDVVELAKQLHAFVLKRVEELRNSGFEKMLSEYNKRLYKKGMPVSLRKDNRLFETVIKSVSADGKLITGEQDEMEFDFGEVEWVFKQ